MRVGVKENFRHTRAPLPRSYFENEVGGEGLDLSTKYAPCDNLVVLDYIPLQSDHPSNSKRGNLDIFL